MSQHRWQDASHLLERALRGIWPSLFSTNVYDITLVHEQVEECVDIVRRLAECYSIRQRKAEEEDIRVRLYRAMRSGGKVGDKLWEQVTQELLSFYTKTRQTEAGITVRQERLDDLTAHHGEQHKKVLEPFGTSRSSPIRALSLLITTRRSSASSTAMGLSPSPKS